ncbi:MAG: HesA/MoeB/ThiF family protein [Porphyromonadaceae bacterium]|nr:HesA/MoeB/ThiF family protein [Porphyromonadaceae bacterium]
MMHDNTSERYIRQTMLPQVGEAGQAKLLGRSALVVGAGGLGSPILYYLTAAGVGRIGIVDDDQVHISNLQRQILFAEEDLGRNKAEQAEQRLKLLNSSTQIDVYPYRLTSECAENIARGYDLIIDATDNLSTRYLLDDTARTLGKPYLYGAVEGFVGQCSLFHVEGSKGYRDLFAEFDVEADARPVGVVGSVAGSLGAIMATEAIKVLLGMPTSLAGYLLRLDLEQMSCERIKL